MQMLSGCGSCRTDFSDLPDFLRLLPSTVFQPGDEHDGVYADADDADAIGLLAEAD
jgi:hypothetical protein